MFSLGEVEVEAEAEVFEILKTGSGSGPQPWGAPRGAHRVIFLVFLVTKKKK